MALGADVYMHLETFNASFGICQRKAHAYCNRRKIARDLKIQFQTVNRRGVRAEDRNLGGALRTSMRRSELTGSEALLKHNRPSS